MPANDRREAKVLGVDRDEALAVRTVRMIVENGGTAHTYVGDATKTADCATAVDRVLSLWGRVDLLDNDVGISSDKTVVEETEE